MRWEPVIRCWEAEIRDWGALASVRRAGQCVLPTLPGQADPHAAPVLNLKGKKCQLYRAQSWGQPVMGQGSGQGQVGWGRGQCTCLARWAAHYKMEDQSGAGGPDDLSWDDVTRCDDMEKFVDQLGVMSVWVSVICLRSVTHQIYSEHCLGITWLTGSVFDHWEWLWTGEHGWFCSVKDYVLVNSFKRLSDDYMFQFLVLSGNGKIRRPHIYGFAWKDVGLIIHEHKFLKKF